MAYGEPWERNAALLQLRNLCGGLQDATLHRITEGFSRKELSVITKHPHLVKRVGEIARMSLAEVRSELENNFGVEIETCDKQGIWASVEGMGDAVPEWFETSHFGWYFDNVQEILTWGQKFLMQEVRINLWMEYIRHKAGKGKEEQVSGSASSPYDYAHWGNYI